MKRKTPCAPEEIPVIEEDNPENRCQFCNRTYSTKSNLKRHLKTCDKDRNMEAMMRLIIEQNQQLIKDNAEFKQQIALPSQPTVINNNQLNIINFVNFPIRDMSKINMQDILRIVNTQPTNQIIPEIVEHLHGNPDFPEQQNIFMARVDSEVTIVFGGDDKKTWHSIPRQEALTYLKSEAMGLLTHQNKPMTNFQLIEAAHDIKQHDTKYQEKIADLAHNDTTEDQVIAQKLVDFGETFHKETLSLY